MEKPTFEHLICDMWEAKRHYLKFKRELFTIYRTDVEIYMFFSFSAGVDKTKDKKSKAGQGEDYYWPGRHIKGTVS